MWLPQIHLIPYPCPPGPGFGALAPHRSCCLLFLTSLSLPASLWFCLYSLSLSLSLSLFLSHLTLCVLCVSHCLWVSVSSLPLSPVSLAQEDHTGSPSLDRQHLCMAQLCWIHNSRLGWAKGTHRYGPHDADLRAHIPLERGLGRRWQELPRNPAKPTGPYYPAVHLRCSDTDTASSPVWARFLPPPPNPSLSLTHCPDG